MPVPSDRLPDSLQESILAVLALDERYGPIVASQVRAEHFDGQLRDAAAAFLRYYARYKRAPGEAQLLPVLLAGKGAEQASSLRRLAGSLVAQAATLNAPYVASRAGGWVRERNLLAAVDAAADRFLAAEEEGTATEVESILRRAIDAPRSELDAGIWLNDVRRGLAFLDRSKEFYKLGIAPLDDAGIGLYPKELLLYIAPKNCLVGETLIDCPRDLVKYPLGIPIADLVGKQFLTYSWDFEQNCPCLSRVSDVWRVGAERVYRVRLSAGLRERAPNRLGGVRPARFLPPLELVGTYNHPVLLSNGRWSMLGELRPGDSLKSMYRRATGRPESSGTMLSWTGARPGDLVAEHRFVCAQVNGPGRSGVWGPGAWGGSDVAHHVDGNRLNHSPDNLRWLESSEHASHHLSERNREGSAGWQKSGVHPCGMLGKTHTKDVRERISRTSSVRAAGRNRDASGRFGPNHEVVSVEYLGVRDVYDMSVERTNNFVANGVFVHNSGKSWFCVHCGRQALLQGAKVVHVTLEMSDTKVVGRYYQSITAAAWKDDKFARSTLEFDDLDRLTGWSTERVRPEASLSSAGARKWLRSRIEKWGTKLGRLVVKEYASGSLTMTELRGYLDYLAAAHRFVPHVLIVDYPDLMSLDTRNYRLDMGRLYVELRGLGQERSMAVVAPTQGNRESLGAKRVGAAMVSEDVSKNFTSDTVLTYSQTEKGEHPRGLARLKVEYARDAERGQTILMAQSYATGQYCLQAALMRKAHWDKLDEVEGRSEDGDGEPERGSTRPRRGR